MIFALLFKFDLFSFLLLDFFRWQTPRKNDFDVESFASSWQMHTQIQWFDDDDDDGGNGFPRRMVKIPQPQMKFMMGPTLESILSIYKCSHFANGFICGSIRGTTKCISLNVLILKSENIYINRRMNVNLPNEMIIIFSWLLMDSELIGKLAIYDK